MLEEHKSSCFVKYLVSHALLPTGLSCHALAASHFSCPSGECLKADSLCDSNKNCKDGTDEIRCGKER